MSTHDGPDGAPQEPLESGWRSDTPIGDTLERRYVYNLAAQMTAPVEAVGGRTERRPEVAMADLGRPSGLFSSAVLLAPPDPLDPLAVVETVERFYDAEGTGEALLWSPWPLPDLSDRGWQLHGHPPFILRPPQGDASVPGPPEGLRILRVHDERGLHAWEQVIVEGFPFESLQPYQPGCLFDARVLEDDRFRAWVGYKGDEPVVAGTLFVDCGIVNVALDVTMPDARRKGYWQGLFWHRVAQHRTRPMGALVSDMSRPGAEALGFLPVHRWTLWGRARPAD